MVLAALSAGFLLSSAPALADSLRDVVDRAIARHPDMGIVRKDRAAIDEELRQARALRLPSVDLRAETGPQYTDSPATRARAGQTGDGEASLWRSLGSLTVTQNLFDGKFTESEIARQQWRKTSAGGRIEETALSVGLDAVEAYIDVLRNRENLRIAEENVAMHRRLRDSIETLRRGGGGTAGDTAQADARLAAARAAQARIRGDLRKAEADFNRVVGELPGQLDPVTPPAIADGGVDGAIARAMVHHPALSIARADLEVAQAELRSTRSTLYPRVDLEVSALQGRDIDGVRGDESGLSALAVLRWNLYRGGADKARERELKWRAAEEREKVEKARRRVERDVRTSYYAYDTAKARVGILRQQVAANEKVVEIYGQQFAIGARSLLDLLDAQNELFLSRLGLTTARHVALFTAYRLIAAEGRLLNHLGLPRPGVSAPADKDGPR